MKLGICIPYRNRKTHLDKLIPSLSKHLNKNNIDHKFYIGHQIDKKLFNRGAMKNIAAKVALDDGCDYIAWHDVDMLPNKEADYSYPKNYPIHIATQLSKYNYGIGYEQYFGGVILFNKAHLKKTNGYSNNYWDWGQEDDDLFWRCYFENLVDKKLLVNIYKRRIAKFNGDNSFLKIENTKEINSLFKKDFTISILFCAEQNLDKYPIWLIGDSNHKFIEYPIFRKENLSNWGISFNNSRTITLQCSDSKNENYYTWSKRYENLWTWVTVSYDNKNQSFYFFINGELVSNKKNLFSNNTLTLKNKMKSFSPKKNFLIGWDNINNIFFKGKISEIKVFDKFFTELKSRDDLKIYYNPAFNQNIGNIEEYNIEFEEEDIMIYNHIVPYRKNAKFKCLPHKDQGLVNGKWARGKTTAKNEKRFVTEMQNKKIDYKKDGLKQIMKCLDIIEINENIYPNTKFINCKMK